MSFAAIKKYSVVAVPVALLFFAYAGLKQVPLLPPDQQELALFAPYLAISCGLVLSLAFNRGRVFYCLLLVGLFYFVARSFLLHGVSAPVPRALYLSFCLLIPANLFLFCFMSERGIMSHAGRVRLAFIAGETTAVYWMVRFYHDYQAIPNLLSRPLFTMRLLEGISLPQSGLFCFLAAGSLISIRAVKRRFPVDLAILGTLVALCICCSWIAFPFTLALFVMAAALLLIIGVLQDSHNMAFTDELTGLPSRRALNEQIMGLGRRYVVAMVDVDHFKKFNDTYGHDVGDQVLRMVAAKIAKVKGGGKSFRYGGEEFTVLFPRKNLQDVTPHLEELREVIASYQLWIRGADRPKETEKGRQNRTGRGGSKAVQVTISIGVAASREDVRRPEEVIKAADKALYRAKQRGRNQVAS